MSRAANKAFEIAVEPEVTPEARETVSGLIASYNEDFVPDDQTRGEFAVLVRDPATGKPLGGLCCRTRREMLVLELVALPPELRGAGLGTKLFRIAETEGYRRGCRGAWLQTSDWQARGFYEKLGYHVFGSLPDYPAGHTRFFMTRRFEVD